MEERTIGRVYLVGAGPGDPELLTLKGARAIAEADVLVYDRLAHPKVLEHAQPFAELIYAGKTPERHTLKQEDINGLLVERAKDGQTVARVKGGDPFLFGRGGEEAEALAEAGVPFEIIPGITSAIAVPAYAGIPVTHRDFTSALGIITGHEDPSKPQSALKWEHLAPGLDTLVFLMSVSRLADIAGTLIANGKDKDTPAAMIEWGTRPEQRCATGTLSTITAVAEEAEIESPAVLVVGEVVKLRQKIRWFDTGPLFGKRIVVTRSREQASYLSSKLTALGATVVEFPVISCRPLESFAELDAAIGQMSSYDWVVFTSANGVEFFMERLFHNGADVRALGDAKIAAMGEATREAIEARSLRVEFTPSRYVGESFVEEFPEFPPGARVIIPRAASARELIPDELRKLGAEVDVVPCYRTVPVQDREAEMRLLLASGGADILTFTSSSTVRSFVEMVSENGRLSLPDNIKVVSIGPITTSTARELGLPVHSEASEHTIPGLVEAIMEIAAG